MKNTEAARANMVPQGIDGAGDLSSGPGAESTRRAGEGACDAQGIGSACETGLRSGKAVRVLWAAGGFAAFGLGALGAVLPILPTTPFLLVAAFCFARSSERSRTWFRRTKLYRTVLEGYVAKRTMSVKAKLALLVPITAVLAVSFALMSSVPAGRAVVAVVWVAHVVYFGFVVKTDRAGAASPGLVEERAAAERVRAVAKLNSDGEGA
ncbi:YbaN family protein [Gordonibacter sp. 28C]|uniref:YbaN family protein n=1 Tax=Gordonibacter sp. 28C TaxID=2078569 RepID=UPI001F543CA5|nr:YbaN family protein [Gordonibacter sp. 28C]